MGDLLDSAIQDLRQSILSICCHHRTMIKEEDAADEAESLN